MLQRVDHGIPGDVYARRVRAFAHEIPACALCRREMKVREKVDHTAIRLLWKRVALVAGTEAGFHVSDAHPFVERRKAGAEGRGRVSLHDDPVRPLRFDDRAGAGDEVRRETRQRLVRRHEVQVMVGHEAEQPEDLPVLSRDAETGVERVRLRPERSDNGAELDRLGTRADHDEHTRGDAHQAVL